MRLLTKNTEELILQELFKNKNNNELILQELIKTKNTEELILQELFNLNQKFDDLKNSTQRQLKRFATKEELKKELELQAKDIAQIFHNTFNTLEKRENKLKLELLKQIH